jgi:topoisomerase-4 subunit B
MSDKEYNASQIRILKGLEPVQLRPAMYTRTDNPNHIIYEVIDNAQDEALAGYANKIFVKMIDEDTIMVEDNGRGIPVDIHPEMGKSTAEIIFTQLHAGGKFDKENEGAYSFAGGLHGVGVTVTNALSYELEAIIKKNGKVYSIKFNNGNLIQELKEIGTVEKKDTGTTIIVKPNPKYFENGRVDVNLLKDYLRVKAALLEGVEVVFQYKEEEPVKWTYSGIQDYLILESNKINHNETYWLNLEETFVPNQTKFIWTFEQYLKEKNSLGNKGEGLKVSIGFLEEGKRFTESFVNLIPTINGGTHERGLKNALFEGLKSFMEHYNLSPKNLTLESDDLWQKISFVLSAKILEPKFQGQTKDRLNNPDVPKLIIGLVKDNFELWLGDNIDFAKKLIEKVIENAQKRTKAEIKIERKRGGGNTTLPGKLADCEENNPEISELFLVEGDSAAGSSKMGRNKNFQAILPMRGKILNTWEINTNDLFNPGTIQDIAIAIGITPHSLEDKIDFSKLRYNKIIAMCDADVDGRHIEVLLQTLFLKHFPQVVKNGHFYIAKAPLFRIDYPSSKKNKSKLDSKVYVQDEKEKEEFLKKLIKSGFSEENIKVSRFKGLGEMNPEQLWDTTLNPETRTIIRIVFDEDHLDAELETFNLLMSKKESKRRREWMEDKGNTVEIDA